MSASRFLGELEMNKQTRKYSAVYTKGFTLVELMAVVAIMGILSALGFAGLQGAVQNNRIRDAAINVTAFMERTASEANRLNSTLCVKMQSDHKTLKSFKGSCSNENLGAQVGEISLDALNQFVTSGVSVPSTCTPILSISGGATFTPKLGLSAAPTGCVLVRYGDTDKAAVIIKSSTKNNLFYEISYDKGSSWTSF